MPQGKGAPDGTGSRASTEPQERLGRSGFDPSRDETWHGNVARWALLLKGAFPQSHRITRLQVAQSIATEVERLSQPERDLADYKALYSDVLHDYIRVKMALEQGIADLRTVGDDYPGSSCHQWCHERADAAQRALRDSDRNPEGRDGAARLGAEHESAGRQASPDLSRETPNATR